MVTDEDWDKQWEGWERPSWPAYTNIRIDWFVEQCQRLMCNSTEESLTAVEVGAGSGWVTRVLTEKFHWASYVCTDVSQSALDKLDALNLPNVTTVKIDVSIPENRNCDIVICGDVYEHVVNREEFLTRIWKQISPGGTLLLTTPNRYMPILFLRRLMGKEATSQPYDRPVDARQLHRELMDSGFQVVQIVTARARNEPSINAATFVRQVILRLVLGVIAVVLRMRGKSLDHAILAEARRPKSTLVHETE